MRKSAIINIQKVLWLDDIRNPVSKEWAELISSYYSPEYPDPITPAIYWVKNYDEFIAWIDYHGLPHHIFFDHDLGESHYAPSEVWESRELYEKWERENIRVGKTGFDCAEWLIHYCADNGLKLPNYSSHSANIYGRENILGLLSSFEKFQNQTTHCSTCAFEFHGCPEDDGVDITNCGSYKSI